MPKTAEIKKPAAEPVQREGTAEVDLGALARLREYLLACDELREAQARKEAARAALDAAGTYATATFGGETAYRYRQGTRRSVDADRLAERWSDAFADCARQSPTSTLVVEDRFGQLVRQRNWRAALRKKP